MTKAEARAILACKKKIEKALDVCREKLGENEGMYADAYWIAHIRDSIQGNGYGTAPMARVRRILSEDEE